MKKVLFFIGGLFLFSIAVQRLSAQSFTVAHDTVRIIDPSGSVNVLDNVTSTSAPVTLKWQVVACDFPADWNSWGLCDNYLCFANPVLWPSMALKTSLPYTISAEDFHFQINNDAATTLGCFYLKVRMYNAAIPTDTATEVFIVCKTHPTAAPVIKSTSELTLYPNPATDEVNVTFDANADVKNIAIYNVIGKVMAVYKVNGNSANMSLDNMPGGIYYVRLVNGEGNIVGTRKFTKNP